MNDERTNDAAWEMANAELATLRRQLLETQAREAALREGLTELFSPNHAFVASDGEETWRWRKDSIAKVRAIASAALATKPDDGALREFGLKVAQRAHEQCSGKTSKHENPTATVEAILKGGA